MKPQTTQTLRQPLLPLYLSSRPSATTLSEYRFPPACCRPFSSTVAREGWLFPKHGWSIKSRKGRPRVPTGGSSRGTTIVWGDWGLRMKDHDRRISSAQLSVGAEIIKRRLKGMKFRLYTRINANIAVFESGNEVRMGKGKGSFSYWAARVAVSKIIFEVKGEMHEKVVRDAMRLAAAHMPGQYEFVKKGDPPVVGITKLSDHVTLADLKNPKITVPEAAPLKPQPVSTAS